MGTKLSVKEMRKRDRLLKREIYEEIKKGRDLQEIADEFDLPLRKIIFVRESCREAREAC